jgi:ATP-dependent DNA helicase PIF1
MDEPPDFLQKLTHEQQKAYLAVEQGKSIFLTGPGGTGKSFLLKTMVDHIPDRTGKYVAVTALTGCAALLIGRFAKTLHSWAGVGLARESPAALVTLIRRSGKALRRWLGTDILIIDEVSMMTPEFFEKLDEVAKLVRRNQKPMGGLQIVFVGDFYQLPPVMKEKDKEIPFLFESPVWSEIVQETVVLTEIHRQKDPVFHKVLGEARTGQISDESLEILRKRSGLPWQQLRISPTLLFTRRAEVDMINERNLKSLKTDKRIFKAETAFLPVESTKGLTSTSPHVKQLVEKMDKDGPYMAELILAIGAQVMLLVNLDFDQGLVNGARGIVVGYDPSGAPLVEFKAGLEIVVPASSWECPELEGLLRKQIPLKLAYAITIHKAQGATLDCALIDIGTSTFEYGQAYVALSRVKDLNSLYIWDVEATAFRAHPKVANFYTSLRNDVSPSRP